MPTAKKPLILVDGSSYLYRAFHAMPALTNSAGQPTGAIYGMINMLKSLLNNYQPEYMAVVFDPKGKTFRDELYPAYKATRSAMPDELAQQIPTIHRIIRALGLPLIMIEGVEADDVIASLAFAAANSNHPTLISTGDKDLAQLVNEHITLINTMNNSVLDPAGVKEKFGVTPAQIVDYLTLVGDTSDNIPGVLQVGPKTAAKWLAQYGSLENIVAHAEQITGKVGENLRAFIPKMSLTQTLVTIRHDLVLPIHLEEMQLVSPDQEQLAALYQQLEFKNWLSALLEKKAAQDLPGKTNYVYATTPLQIAHALKNPSDIIAIHLETVGHGIDARLLGFAIALKPGQATYFALAHLEQPEKPDETANLAQFKTIFENPSIKKIAHDLKAAMTAFANAGIQLQAGTYDVMLESYLLDSVSRKHDEESLALKYLGKKIPSRQELLGKASKQQSFAAIPISDACQFAAQRADIIFEVHNVLLPRIDQEPGLKRVLNDIEMPLIPVLASMEHRGVLIDPALLIAQGKELEQRLLVLQTEAYQLAQSEFNMHSPKQLQAVLFEQLKLPVLQKTPTGQASTSDEVLQELALEFELPRLIIEHRSLSKLISTYTYPLVEQINPKTKRVHTSYNQTVTSTGRLSSSNPNLQNIPVRTEEGRRIRQAFIAPKGYKIISADYSQIELRLVAHMSKDQNLLKAFAQGLDIHQATAAEVWEVSLTQVTNTMRRDAKAINFGLLYGMSAFGLSRQLGIARKDAEVYINRYFERYPQVKAYMDSTRQSAKEKGYVETLWGRRLSIPGIHASQVMQQKAAERAAINAPLQGTAADIIKLAMIEIDRWLSQEKINASMIMQVHDELVFEAAASDCEMIIKGITERMTKVADLSVPLLVSVGVGNNWDAAAMH